MHLSRRLTTTILHTAHVDFTGHTYRFHCERSCLPGEARSNTQIKNNGHRGKATSYQLPSFT